MQPNNISSYLNIFKSTEKCTHIFTDGKYVGQQCYDQTHMKTKFCKAHQSDSLDVPKQQMNLQILTWPATIVTVKCTHVLTDGRYTGQQCCDQSYRKTDLCKYHQQFVNRVSSRSYKKLKAELFYPTDISKDNDEWVKFVNY